MCAADNENTLTIADVTDKENPIMVARETYEDVYYTHQGWLTEDHSHLFLDDEIDELSGPSQVTSLPHSTGARPRSSTCPARPQLCDRRWPVR